MHVVANVAIGESVPQMKDAMAHGSDPEILVDCFGTHRRSVTNRQPLKWFRVGNLQAMRGPIIWAEVALPDFMWVLVHFFPTNIHLWHKVFVVSLLAEPLQDPQPLQRHIVDSDHSTGAAQEDKQLGRSQQSAG